MRSRISSSLLHVFWSINFSDSHFFGGNLTGELLSKIDYRILYLNIQCSLSKCFRIQSRIKFENYSAFFDENQSKGRFACGENSYLNQDFDGRNDGTWFESFGRLIFINCSEYRWFLICEMRLLWIVSLLLDLTKFS